MSIFESIAAFFSGISPAETIDIIVNSGSMILALIAIFASFRVAHTQNQVALFNIRYDAWFELRHILDFAARLRSQKGAITQANMNTWRKFITDVFNAEFSTSLHACTDEGITQAQRTTALVEMRSDIRDIEKVVKANQFATENVDGTAVDQLLDALRDFMSATITGNKTVEAFTQRYESFCALAEAFESRHFDRTFRSTQLYHEWWFMRAFRAAWQQVKRAMRWLGGQCCRLCKGIAALPGRIGRGLTALWRKRPRRLPRKPASGKTPPTDTPAD